VDQLVLTALIGLLEVLRLIRVILVVEKGMTTVFGLDGYLFGPLSLSQSSISPCRSVFSTHPAGLLVEIS